jgi:hypothetical protein
MFMLQLTGSGFAGWDRSQPPLPAIGKAPIHFLVIRGRLLMNDHASRPRALEPAASPPSDGALAEWGAPAWRFG